MLNIFHLFLFSFLNNVYAHPFNSTICFECIDDFNYIHKHNNSINKIMTEVNTFCDEYNISGCENMTNYVDKLIMQNSTIICQELGVCDRLDVDNFVIDIYGPIEQNIKIYRYYDLLIGFRVNIISDSILNYTKLWQTKISEPYWDVSKININPVGQLLCNGDTTSPTPPPPSQINPDDNFRRYDYILKVSTDNYIYYMNVTTGTIIDRLSITNNEPLDLDLYYSNNNQPIVNDYLFNGSIYKLDININVIISNIKYNTTTNDGYSCIQNPTTGLWECKRPCNYNNVNTINILPLNVYIPEQSPTCHEALETYCPRSLSKRELCLNCLVKNQAILSQCTVLEEEYWCDNFH